MYCLNNGWLKQFQNNNLDKDIERIILRIMDLGFDPKVPMNQGLEVRATAMFH